MVIKIYWSQAEVVLLAAVLVHTLLKYWIATEVSRRFSEVRNNGVLELLLVTPLSIADVLQGFLAITKQQFLVPVILALLGDVSLLYLGVTASTNAFGLNNLAPLLFAAMAMLVTDAYALCWVGMWKALSVPNPRWAFFQTFLLVMVMPWFVMLGLAALSGAISGDGTWLSVGWLVVLWFGAGYVTDIVLSVMAVNRLSTRFRELVAGKTS